MMSGRGGGGNAGTPSPRPRLSNEERVLRVALIVLIVSFAVLIALRLGVVP